MKSLHIDTARLGPIYLQESYRPIERDGRKVTTGNGELVYLARAVVPGCAPSGYRDPTAGQIRLKAIGGAPNVNVGPITLAGKVTLTSWYQRGGRGVDARCEATITAERVEQAPAGTLPTVSGLLPVRLPLAPGQFPVILGQTEQDRADLPWRVVVALPEGMFDGLVEIDSPISVENLLGQPVEVQLDAKLIVPDREDVGRSAKAEINLIALSWSAVATTAPARSPRGRSDETTTEQTSEAA